MQQFGELLFDSSTKLIDQCAMISLLVSSGLIVNDFTLIGQSLAPMYHFDGLCRFTQQIGTETVEA